MDIKEYLKNEVIGRKKSGFGEKKKGIKGWGRKKKGVVFDEVIEVMEEEVECEEFDEFDVEEIFELEDFLMVILYVVKFNENLVILVDDLIFGIDLI